MRLGRLFATLAALTLTACSSGTPHGAVSAASSSPLPVATGDYPMYGRASDFSWIAGRVERSLSCTYLRFGERRRAPWGGRVPLDASPEQMSALQSGDAIVVKGDLIRLAYGACGAPSYLVRSIEEH